MNRKLGLAVVLFLVMVFAFVSCGGGSGGGGGIGFIPVQAPKVDESFNGGNYTGDIPQKWRGIYDSGDKLALTANTATAYWGILGPTPVTTTGYSVSLGGKLLYNGSVVGEYVNLRRDDGSGTKTIGILIALDTTIAGEQGILYKAAVGNGSDTSGDHGVKKAYDSFVGNGVTFDPDLNQANYTLTVNGNPFGFDGNKL